MYRSKLLLIISIIFLAACQKELKFDSESSTGSEIGTWKFVSMQTNMNVTLEGEQNGLAMKVVTAGDYTTVNNGGTITFDDPNMSFAGITYSVDATAKAALYVGGVLINNSDFPITGSQPPTDDTGEYEKFGVDSIFVQSDALSIIDPGGILQNTGLGFKLKWNGDQMTMTTRIQELRDEEYMGVPVKANVDITAVFKLERQ